MRGCNTGEMAFENCRIPKDMLLGTEGKGLRVALGAIGDVGRGGMVGCALGIHHACLEASIKFAKERILYGKPIAALQGVANKLAEMKIDLEAGTLLAYRACAMQDKGLQAGNEFAIAKYFTTEACQRAAKMGVDIHGGYGCMEEYAVSRYLRDSYVVGPSAGTSDIMKVIVSRAILA
jgi:alkylation response protein AidB-like acyl-CoA dehydrogenase